MRGRTHAIVGMATALTALIPTNNIGLIVSGTVATAFGAIIPDIDVDGTNSLAKKELGKAALFTVAYAGTMPLLLELTGKAFTITALTLSSNLFIGLGILTVYSLLGFASPHRGFTHSIEGLLMATLGVYFTLPVLTTWFATGYITHLLLDLLNKKPIKLCLMLKKKFSFNLCTYDGIVDKLFNYGGKAYIFAIIYVWLFYLLGNF